MIVSPNVIPTKSTIASKKQQKIALLKKDPRNDNHVDEINKELGKGEIYGEKGPVKKYKPIDIKQTRKEIINELHRGKQFDESGKEELVIKIKNANKTGADPGKFIRKLKNRIQQISGMNDLHNVHHKVHHDGDDQVLYLNVKNSKKHDIINKLKEEYKK